MKGFDFIGDLLGCEEFIKSVILFKIGEFYNGFVVMFFEEFIKSYLVWFGYVNVEVCIILEIDDENKEV